MISNNVANIGLYNDYLKLKHPLPEKEQESNIEFKKHKGYGSIINTTGEKIFSKCLQKKYCPDFLNVGEVCKFRDSCTFEHAI